MHKIRNNLNGFHKKVITLHISIGRNVVILVGYTIKVKLFKYVEKFCLYDVLCRTMYNVDAYALVKHALHVLQQIKKTTQGIAGCLLLRQLYQLQRCLSDSQ